MINITQEVAENQRITATTEKINALQTLINDMSRANQIFDMRKAYIEATFKGRV